MFLSCLIGSAQLGYEVLSLSACFAEDNYTEDNYIGAIAVNPEAEAPSTSRPAASADQLRTGMSYHDIVRLFGAPDDRTEFESRRQDRWKYGDLEIFFSSGKVVAWSGRSTAAILAPVATAKSPVDEAAVEEILLEIMTTPQAEQKATDQ